MATYPTAHRIKALLAGVWTDLTAYVVDDITGGWGIQSNGPLDLLADPGVLNITLNNMDGRFTPGSATALVGWKKNAQVDLEIDYDGQTYKHHYMINDIFAPLGTDLIDKAFVTVTDWLEDAATHPVINPVVLGNQRANDAIFQLLGHMPLQPAASDLQVGVSVFPTVFDTITSETKGYSELAKLALSEGGIIYLRKDKVYGETLVFENSQSRNGLRTLDTVPLASPDSGSLLKEDGGHLLKEDGGRLLLDQRDTFFADNSMLDLQTDYGRNVINYFKLTAYPRRLDASPQILFKLDIPLPIASGQTIQLKGSYADPAGGGGINAKDMLAPVVTTDYLAFTLANGTGTNFSADLVITPGYGADGFTHQVKNNGVNSGWITKFNCRGTGIYQYNPIDGVEKDQDSIDEFGYQTETLDQKYQTSLAEGMLYVERVVEREKQPRIVVREVFFWANQSPALMMAFLNFGPGSLIRIKNDRRNIDGYFYIQGVKNFKLTPGGMIMFTWIVKETLTLALGLTMMAVDFAGFGSSATDGINFGPVPHVTNLHQRSIGAQVYLRSDVPDTTYYGIVGYGVNYLLIIKQNRKIKLYDQQMGVSGAGGGDWTSTNSNVIPLNAWTKILVTHNTAEWPNNSVPIIYVDGVAIPLTQDTAPSGNFGTEEGLELVIGNVHANNNDFSNSIDGKIKNVQIHNVILTPTEALDYTAVTRGLLFKAFAVRTADATHYTNLTLTDTDKLLDAFLGIVGTPHGSPISRMP